MKERFSRLFTLPENQYAEGAPVLIAAGALLKDNETGKLLAQLKFKSIVNAEISAVIVGIKAFDVSGLERPGVEEYQYLDLHVQRDQEFGQKHAILLPDAVTRSYSCQIKKVIFQNGSLWEAEGKEYVALKSAPLLKVQLGKLADQYVRDTSFRSNYVVTDDRDLWICSCGAINRQDESSCHDCHWEKQALLAALDRGQLEAHNTLYEFEMAEKRREEEERKRLQSEEAAKAAAIAKEKAKKAAKKTGIILAVCAVVCVAAFLLMKDKIAANKAYKEAYARYEQVIALYEEGKYAQAAKGFWELDDFEDSANYIAKCREMLGTTIDTFDGHTVALRKDGTVVATGSNNYGECNVQNLTNVVSLSSVCGVNTAALLSDGTVCILGGISSVPEAVKKIESWTDIIAISGGPSGILALKADGTVNAYGGSENVYESIVLEWKNVVDIAVGENHIVGLKEDGTLYYYGKDRPDEKQDGYTWKSSSKKDVTYWQDVIDIESGIQHILGLTSDGGVLAKGWNLYGGDHAGQCDTYSWYDIIDISGGFFHTVGVKEDGTVVAVGNNNSSNAPKGRCDVDDWRNIVAVAAGTNHTVALKSDGTVVAVGDNDAGQCNVSSWRDIKLPGTLSLSK